MVMPPPLSPSLPGSGAVLASVPQAYNHCTECVNKILTLNGQGILPTGWGDPYSPTQTPIPAYQFGKCVAEGQLIMAIVNGDERPTGVQSLCFDAQRKYAVSPPAPCTPL